MVDVIEEEQVTVQEIGQNTDEEDRYIKMKDFYKQGKEDALDLLGAGVEAHDMAQTYTDDLDLIEKYLMGWNYSVHLSNEKDDE